MDTRSVLALAEARRLVAASGRMIRRGAGLTLLEVAESLGVDKTTVYRWETGERVPRHPAVVDYAALLRELVAR